MLHLVLAEAELERVPEAISDHPQVRASARRRDLEPGVQLLDGSLHHAAMRDLEDADRRGRPDIVHFALLVALASRAGRAGLVRPWVHTRHDDWITVDPKTRLPKQLDRFKGLARQLLQEGRVGPEGRDLLSLEQATLEEGLADLPGPATLMTADAEPVPPATWVGELAEDATVVVGAFPEGTLRSPPDGPRVALPGGPTLTWVALGEIVCHAAAHRLDGPHQG